MIVECPACRARYDASGRAPGSRFRCRCGAEVTIGQPGADAGTLDCPRCGAPASPDSTSCAYCHAALALVGCPRCLGRVFAGARFCQHCGAPLEVPAQPLAAAAVTMRCPRCPESSGARLAPRAVGKTHLEECPACAGTWVDGQTFAAIVADRDRQAALASALPGLTAEARPVPEAEVRYLKCPDCARLMNRENFGRRSGVVVDVCKAHGVWFDGGELGEVVGFVMRGGLDESRRRELEEARQELQRRRAELGEETVEGGALELGGRDGASLLERVLRLLR
jgi:Zn-finger nucleic acid-binding protein